MGKVFGKGILSIALLTCLSANASAIVISDQLYNTGLDESGDAVVSGGGLDGNWQVDGNNAVTYKHPAYAANDSDSLWVSVNKNGGNETNSATTYTYSTTFDLAGYDASSAVISGLWGVDNYASIFLNGIDTGNLLSFGYSAFNQLSHFSISDYFINGVNTLSVELTNGHLNPARDPGPGALRFDNLQLQATAVAEPGNIVLFSLGFLGLFFSRRQLSS